MTYTIMVVEDEKGIRDTVRIFLENQGYHVLEAENGRIGWELLQEETVHLMIVDIMMPVMDGITLTLKARTICDVPIIFLSAKSEEIDKITGLNIGADDYITKPFSSMELLARVNSQLRRYEQLLRLKNQTEENKEHGYTVGGLYLDDYTKELTVDGKNIRLTAKEYQILELLMKHPGRVYSTEQIYEIIWQEQAINTETIMVHIRKLREKIELNPKKPVYLKVVWGLGYKIEKV